MPLAHARHAPAPSHMPSLPHVDGACCAHSSSGSVPFVTGRQRPSAAAVLLFEQALQLSVQADSQQTPSTHSLLAHCAAVVQLVPFPAPVGVSGPPASTSPPPPPVPAEPPVPPDPPVPVVPAEPPVPVVPPVPATPIAPPVPATLPPVPAVLPPVPAA